MWTRRGFLKASGLTLFSVGLGGTPMFLARAAEASSGQKPRRKTLVAVFQRGAMDGLMAVQPLEDRLLSRHRPRLLLRSSGSAAPVRLDGRFGLHPALAAFEPLFREGRLAIMHGVGSPDATRSHFDAQDYMETGTPGRKGTATGWLNRASGLLGHEGTPFRSVALTSSLPRSLYGPGPALAISDLAEFKLEASGGRAGEDLESLYRDTSQELLRGTGGETFEAMKILSSKEFRGYRPAGAALYPRSPLGDALRQVAQLIKTRVGLEIAFAESGGWDTHVAQGNVQGSFANRARDLAQAVAAFWVDVQDHREDVVLMTMTEFGRTVRENGSGGTDHGRGSCMFVLGQRVRGGRVHGTVPELARENLEEGRDLPVTTDFRAVFSEVAGKHLQLSDTAGLFPGWTGRPPGIMA